MTSPVMDVWIYKPNVIHKQIFGSRITYSSDRLIKRIIYPKLSVNLEPVEERITIEKSG